MVSVADVGVEAHPLLRASEEQRPHVELAPQSLHTPLEIRFVTPASDHLSKLTAIRCHQARPAVLVPILALGVDQHGLVRGARALDHRPDVGEASLTVVGQHQGVGGGQQRVEIGELGGEELVRRRGLEVDTQ